MRFLLTNDDGIDAAGLAALTSAARELGETVTIAPAGALSGCSHRVSTDGPFEVETRSANVHVVHGTPADCVRVGLYRDGASVDWILSGINHGGNLGVDLIHSGTAAAIREGVFYGKPGIALSHYRKRGLPEFDWRRAALWVGPVIRDLTARPWQPGTFWNVNLPHLPSDAADPAVCFCPVDRSPLPLEYRVEQGVWTYSATYQQRQRMAGSDVDTCFRGQIAVSLVQIA
jgi:5'-nucleotidase